MKKFLFLLALFACISTGWAQRITFQGKLYQNNQPINGSGSFKFFINSGGVNWFEPHPSVPVNNGLYAVVLGSITALPLDLFKQSQSIPMEVRYNDVLVDTVTLYAPFERDYTVPDNIKDGISWDEVSNKPTLDTDSANELQTLTLQGNTLSLSPGNSSVTLPAQGGNNNTVTGSFQVRDTSVVVMTSQTVNSNSASVSSAWQSFLVNNSGKLRGIEVYLGVNGNNFVTVNIHEGAGPFDLIRTEVITGLTGGATSRILDLSGMVPELAMNSGQLYTFEVIAPVGQTINISYSSVNVYQNGLSNFGVGTDLYFKVLIDHTNPASLSVAQNGFVGVGMSNPSAQLQVGGRIKDATGFIMPVGSILPYGGNVLSGEPEGWLLCDGRSVSRIQYAELFAAIGTAWGSANEFSFNLPDLRGGFLRGVDTSQYLGSSGTDPDRAASVNNGTDGKRYAKSPGGNTGNNVGSYQGDELKRHKHDLIVYDSQGNSNNYPTDYYPNPSVPGINSSAIQNTGGNESRPKNAYVNYIIKY